VQYLSIPDTSTVWTVDFETPVCKLYLLFISADAAKEKEKIEESAAAHWCFKVCSPYSMSSQLSRKAYVTQHMLWIVEMVIKYWNIILDVAAAGT
jgi:hypothetical protein